MCRKPIGYCDAGDLLFLPLMPVGQECDLGHTSKSSPAGLGVREGPPAASWITPFAWVVTSDRGGGPGCCEVT